MRYGRLWFGLLVAACALPARVEDRSTPRGAYETFRGALARQEYGREFECLSDDLREKLRVKSRAEWQDVRVVGLKQSHVAVKAIVNSDLIGEPELLPDGRALLNVRLKYLVVAKDGRIWARRVPVLRIWIEGDERPLIYRQPDFVELAVDPGRGIVGVRLPTDVIELVIEECLEPGEKLRWIEAGLEWFLDDFDTGDRTASSVREELQQK